VGNEIQINRQVADSTAVTTAKTMAFMGTFIAALECSRCQYYRWGIARRIQPLQLLN